MLYLGLLVCLCSIVRIFRDVCKVEVHPEISTMYVQGVASILIQNFKGVRFISGGGGCILKRSLGYSPVLAHVTSLPHLNLALINIIIDNIKLAIINSFALSSLDPKHTCQEISTTIKNFWTL